MNTIYRTDLLEKENYTRQRKNQQPYF